MDIREKLAELLGKAWEVWNDYIRKWYDNAEKTGDWNAPMTSHDDICADFLIANGVTIQEWIPVTERLPEDGQSVLTYKNGIYDIQTYEARRNGWVSDSWFWSMATVTHWMPLPEPPKGGQ